MLLRSTAHAKEKLGFSQYGRWSLSRSLNLIAASTKPVQRRDGYLRGGFSIQPNMKTADLQPSFNLQEEHKELRNALRGLSCNEKKVIEILGRRSQAQRDSIAESYKVAFGESLQKRVKAAVGTKLVAKCVMLWLMQPSEREAVLLHEGLREGGASKDRAAIAMLCTRTAAQIFDIKQAFYTLFHQTLEHCMDGSAGAAFPDPSAKSKWAFWRSASDSKYKDLPKRDHAITKLLLALARGSRPVSTTIDRHIALQDAHQLNKVCNGKVGNNETLIRIFCTRSSYQLTATLNFYQQHYGHDFEKALSKKDAGEFLQALRPVVKCLRQPSKFYAEELATALSGAGSADEETVIGIVTTRAEVDLQVVKVEFRNECKRSLEDAISSATAGNVRQCLLAAVAVSQGEQQVCSSSPRASTASSYYMSTTCTSNGGSRRDASDSSQTGSASYFSGSVGSNSQNSF